jgi:hypothetical protein
MLTRGIPTIDIMLQQLLLEKIDYYWNKLKTGISGSSSTSIYSSPRPIGYLICGLHKDACHGCQLANDEEVSDVIHTWFYLYPKTFFTDNIRNLSLTPAWTSYKTNLTHNIAFNAYFIEQKNEWPFLLSST